MPYGQNGTRRDGTEGADFRYLHQFLLALPLNVVIRFVEWELLACATVVVLLNKLGKNEVYYMHMLHSVYLLQE